MSMRAVDDPPSKHINGTLFAFCFLLRFPFFQKGSALMCRVLVVVVPICRRQVRGFRILNLEWCVTLHLILVMIPTVQVPLCVVNGILIESYR
jgi:hypothetical protein